MSGPDQAPHWSQGARRERHVGQAFKLIWSLVDEISLTSFPTDQTVTRWIARLDESRKVMAEGLSEPYE